MKKILFYSIIIAIIGICLFFIIQKRKVESMPVAETPQSHETEATNILQSSFGASARPVSNSALEKTAPSMNLITNEILQHKLESLSNAVQNYSAQVNNRIEFYGKVIDENNQPIEGASVEFVWAQMWPLPEGTPSTNIISNSEGLFSLAGVVGARLGVHVAKNGYDNVNNLNSHEFSYSTLAGITPFQPDSNSPILFHLRKSP